MDRTQLIMALGSYRRHASRFRISRFETLRRDLAAVCKLRLLSELKHSLPPRTSCLGYRAVVVPAGSRPFVQGGIKLGAKGAQRSRLNSFELDELNPNPPTTGAQPPLLEAAISSTRWLLMDTEFLYSPA